MRVSAASVVEEYYDALRRGDPLEPYVADGASTVKFGVSESLFGAEAVRRALREQTRTTEDWTVESRRLTVDEQTDVAWFADSVALEWTDCEDGTRRSFDTRWSGTLLAAGAASTTTDANREAADRGQNAAEEPAKNTADGTEPAWLFATMHVSAPEQF